MRDAADVTHDEAMKFLKMLKERMSGWPYDNWDAEIEYIEEVLWRDNDMSTS